MTRAVDFTGCTVSYLQVLSRAPNTSKGSTVWRCRCVCGRAIFRLGTQLKEGAQIDRVQSCGCKKGLPNSTHQMSKHKVYKVYQQMLLRCLDAGHPAYKDYGGRSIKVCERWLQSFKNFWTDMGSTWQQGLTLDRRDNEQGYSPENCRWATRSEQSKNRRNSIREVDLASLSTSCGLKYSTLWARYRAGCTAEQLTRPSQRPKHDGRNTCQEPT